MCLSCIQKYLITKALIYHLRIIVYLLLRFPMSSSLVSPEQRQDMACFKKLLEKAETNKTRMIIFLEIRFSNLCVFGATILDAIIRLID